MEIHTSHDANTGVWSLQNLVTVRAEQVTIENITFTANYNGYYEGPNKTIEVYADEGNHFTLRNCTLVDGGNQKDAGCLYLGTDTGAGQQATVENCTFVHAGISVRPNTEATITGCTFEGIRERDEWNTALGVRGVAEVEKCTFTGTIPSEYTASVVTALGNGRINLNQCNFPSSEGVYWSASDFGSVFVDYQSVVDQVWTKDRTEPKSFAISNDVIELETMTAPSNNWYSWHGRKAQVNLGVKNSWSVETTLTIPEVTRPVRQTVWLNVCDVTGVNRDWAIVGYKIESEGQGGFFETWDSSGEGAWNPVTLESLNLQPGDQATIRLSLTTVR